MASVRAAPIAMKASHENWMTGDCKAGLVSVIVPTYNRAGYLMECMKAVTDQSYRQWQVIVVDDGSTDNSCEVVQGFIKQYGSEQIIYQRQENAGPAAARNAGLAISRGEYIQYLDSDDWIHPRKLEVQVAQLQSDGDIGLSYCVTTRFTKRPMEPASPSALTGCDLRTILPHVLTSRIWHTLSPLWRRSACVGIGPWRSFLHWEDWEYDCRAGCLGIRPIWCSETLCCVRDHVGARASKPDAMINEAVAAEATAESVLSCLKGAGMDGPGLTSPLANRLFTAARLFAMCGDEDGFWRCIQRAQRVGGTLMFQARLRLVGSLSKVMGCHNAVKLAESVRKACS